MRVAANTRVQNSKDCRDSEPQSVPLCESQTRSVLSAIHQATSACDSIASAVDFLHMQTLSGILQKMRVRLTVSSAVFSLLSSVRKFAHKLA